MATEAEVKVRKWSYGKYDSGNYGAHSLAVEIGGLRLYFSYDTVVAFTAPEKPDLRISENVWGTTTGKHLNRIHPDKSIRIPHEQFERELAEVLKAHNLAIS